MVENSSHNSQSTPDGDKNQVLIVGLLPFDSGKTTMACSLLREARERGLDVGVSKPLSSMSGWYQYSCVERSIQYGKLVGGDMYRLHEAAGSTDPIEWEGPLVSLLTPPDPERVDWESQEYLGLSLNLPSQLVMTRVSSIHETKHYCVPSNAERLTGVMREEVNRVFSSVENPVEVDLEFINALLFNSYTIADECVEHIIGKHDFVVVESYNNAAAPTPYSLNAQSVIAVAPGKAAFYSGELYRKALTAVSSIKEPWKTTTEEILKLMRPFKTMELRPSSTENTRFEGILDSIVELRKS
ncbi:MAG: ATPase [Candidatus Hadarchaeota archaeon]